MDSHRSSNASRDQSGSAFVVVLMVLVVLTFVGLALSLMTESEVLIGWNERLSTRMFYAADSGVAIATSRRHLGETNEIDVQLSDSMAGSDPALLRLSPYFPINNGPCNLCDIHAADVAASYQKRYERINHWIGVEAVRTDAAGAGDFAGASRFLSVMVDLQPIEPTATMINMTEGSTRGIRN